MLAEETRALAARRLLWRRGARRRVRGAQVGRLVAVAGSGAPIVDAPAMLDGPRPALLAAACPVAPLEGAVGRRVVLLFEDADPERPIVVAWVADAPHGAARGDAGAPSEVRVDGRRIVVAGESEIELRTGKASLTLTADGKILLKGVSVLSHAKGMNRIRGAAVRVN